ncbi:MAG: hypothetical protein JRN24_03685, partial [Nitrososphaerota archaeon]|nr:hypothetical protein [Nitrososphaerota archaeon]
EMIPARTISAMYAPSFSPSASIAAMNGVMTVFALKWVNCGPNGIPTGIFYRREDEPTFQERASEINGGKRPAGSVQPLDPELTLRLMNEFS